MGLKRHQPYPMEASLYGAPAPGGMNMMYPAGPFGFPNQASLFPAVRLRGLPFDCSEVDVVDFLQGLDLIDILFIHNGGRFTGEAYCLLAYAVQVQFLSDTCLVADYLSLVCYSTRLVSSRVRPGWPDLLHKSEKLLFCQLSFLLHEAIGTTLGMVVNIGLEGCGYGTHLSTNYVFFLVYFLSGSEQVGPNIEQQGLVITGQPYPILTWLARGQ